MNTHIGPVVFLLLAIFLIWMSETGRLTALREVVATGKANGDPYGGAKAQAIGSTGTTDQGNVPFTPQTTQPEWYNIWKNPDDFWRRVFSGGF